MSAYKAKPPYISWPLFKRLVLKTIKNHKPVPVSHTELSSWGFEIGAAKKALPACKALGIIDGSGAPNRDMWMGLQQDGAEYNKWVREMLRVAYGSLLDQYEDICQVPLDQLRAKFAQEWTLDSPSSRDAAVNFFFGLCEEAGIEMSAARSTQEPAVEKNAPNNGKRAQRNDRARAEEPPQPASLTVAEGTPAGQPIIAFAIHITGAEDEDEIERRIRKIKTACDRVFGN